MISPSVSVCRLKSHLTLILYLHDLLILPLVLLSLFISNPFLSFSLFKNTCINPLKMLCNVF